MLPKMPTIKNPNRSPTFRLITIAASGLGSFVIGLWGLKLGFGDSIAGMSLARLHQVVTFLGDLILPIWLTILLIDIARILI